MLVRHAGRMIAADLSERQAMKLVLAETQKGRSFIGAGCSSTFSQFKTGPRDYRQRGPSI
jgi:hypothetical protein